jgi:hypothetical protein
MGNNLTDALKPPSKRRPPAVSRFLRDSTALKMTAQSTDKDEHSGHS